MQHALLKIMEGIAVRLGNAQYVDTTNMLFICGGAFVGLNEIMAQTAWLRVHLDGERRQAEDPGPLNSRVKPTDLFTFGLIPEFTGRLPIIAHFHDLTRKMLVRIMTEPKNSIYSQFQEIFDNEGVELTVEPQVFEQISELAFEYKTGARSLRGIFEELVTPILYAYPTSPTYKK